MTNQAGGLRFDVYERIHLPDDVASIGELEEMELVPRIQVIDQGEQALLKGQLLLSGVYRSSESVSSLLTLEHWIPVEITLPMNRVSRLEDVLIEIDNFDVDLLSSRTLNVTGVLSLRGLTAEAAPQELEEWQEEPITVVHKREQADLTQESEDAWEASVESEVEAEKAEPVVASLEQTQEAEAVLAEQQADEEQTVIPVNAEAQESARDSYPDVFGERVLNIENTADEDSWISAFGSVPSSEKAQISQHEDVQIAQETAVPEQVSEAEPASLEAEEYAEESAQSVLAADVSAEQEASSVSSEEASQAEEPPGLRIAFAGKPADGSGQGEEVSAVGLQTLLQSSHRERASREAAEEQELEAQQLAAEQEAEQIAEADGEWKRLFHRDNEGEFKRIRLCIVQRDETLETIAQRYSLSPRDIVAHNRLQEAAIEEGQLLYIP